MPEMKWPGWPELPFLLLFVGVVVLVAFVLLEAQDSGAEDDSLVEQSAIAPEGSESR